MSYKSPNTLFVIFHTNRFGEVEIKGAEEDEEKAKQQVKYWDCIPKSGRSWYESYIK